MERLAQRGFLVDSKRLRDRRRRGAGRAYFAAYSSMCWQVPVCCTAEQVIGVRLYVEHENHVAQATYREMGLEMTHYHVMEKFPLGG